MRVLVSAASRHGSTEAIAAAIAATLRESGLEVVETPPDMVGSLEGIDALVLGSAVYAGRWLGAAREFVRGHADELVRIPVWLFSSGPVGDPPKPDGESPDVAAIRTLVEPRDHGIFAGKVSPGDLGLAERAIIAALHAPTGDYRRWEDIRAWSLGIAKALGSAGAGVGRRPPTGSKVLS